MANLFKHSTVEDLIEKVRLRPGMYFYKPSLTGLWGLLCAYEAAVYEHDVPTSERLDCTLLDEFDDWLRHQFGMGNAIGWYLFIMHQTQSEQEAWERFLELWDTFRKD
ncbi:hypothetical protein H6G89_29535 [Oscillatoria sp. FACHB-1407]|uniref:hypothetical protein n=1 Tax=Oscillatoria sp. FACHB-1407 TaxID=2692847 RepID=UPI0016883575|nr:hypothetical protein [Oscillatoria sp. FACHB-1407]MBD2465154.1 hypothetical protein [Oscillatoria sp. FACHB-1407]